MQDALKIDGVEVKGYRAVRGHDGQGFEATLYVDGKATAALFDDGWGGPIQITPLYRKGKQLAGASDRIRALQERVKTLGAVEPEGWGFVVDFGEAGGFDSWLGILCEDAGERAQVTRWCRKKIVFRTPDMAAGEYLSINRPYSAELASKVRAEHGENVEIMNETLGLAGAAQALTN